MNEDIRVRLLAPKVWQPLVKQSFATLKSQEKQFAESALMTMHNRHVGVTPELVAQLTPLLFDPAAHARAEGAWGAIFNRMIDELSDIGDDNSQKGGVYRQRRFGVLLSASPIYSVLRLAMPMVEEACRQIGRCYLFCADEIDTSVQAKNYDEYAKALSAKMRQMAESKEEKWQLFWKERAFTLATFSRQPTMLGNSNTTLPQADPTTLGFLFRLDETANSNQQSQSLRRLRTPIKRQRSRSRKEGGIHSIQITRREEDIPNILLSEFTNHRLVLADHLINTGYLAVERRPKNEKLRDVLITALMPGELRAKLSADFVKTCWFNTIMRLSLLLSQHRLYQSEFRWIEGDRFDRARTNVFLLQDMPTFSAAFENVPSKAYRQEFMTALRWFPSYLDTRERFHPLSSLPPQNWGGNEGGATDRLKQWITSAWRDQKEHLHWARSQRHKGKSRRGRQSRQARTSGMRLKADEFAFVHVMLFLPANRRAEMRKDAISSLVGEMSARLRLGRHPGRNASITWVPDYIEKSDYEEENSKDNQDGNNLWAFAAPKRPDTPLFGDVLPEKNAQEIAEEIEQAWFNQLVQEIQRV